MERQHYTAPASLAARIKQQPQTEQEREQHGNIELFERHVMRDVEKAMGVPRRFFGF